MGSLARSAVRLTGAEWRVALEAVALLPLAALAVRLCPPRRAVALMIVERPGSPEAPSARRIAAVVDAVLTLARGRCFSKTLVLRRILGRRGIATDAVLGVDRHGSALAAHAWLEWHGDVLIGAGSRRYTELWRARGADAA
jgi:hypothetical protein